MPDRADSGLDRILDRVCLEKGLATQDQIVPLLLERKSPGASSLSQLFVSKRILSTETLAALRKRLAPLVSTNAPYEKIRQYDERLANRLIGFGDATQGQVSKALFRQEAEASSGSPVRLSVLLLERGDVTLATLERACTTATKKKTNGAIPEAVRNAASDPRNLMGKYVATEEIGRGSMGVVLKAWDTVLHRWVALKKLTGLVDDDALARFRREARTVAALRHPNIAGVHDIFTDSGRSVLVMEFIPGNDLGMKKKTPHAAARIVAAVAMALDHVHSLGIVHRDIKPQNILLDRDGKPYLMDFGIAKHLEDGSQATALGTVIGTPNYMPPEQAEGDSRLIGPWTDVYSLGAVLYELLTGRPPFDGRDDFVILDRVLKTPVTPPSRVARNVPPELEAIILRCMEKDREKRFPSARSLAEALRAFLDGQSAPAPAPVSRFRRLFSRDAGKSR